MENRGASQGRRTTSGGMQIWKNTKMGGSFSKTKLLLGAGGLLLFIIGVKRSHRLADDSGLELSDRGEHNNHPEEAGAGHEIMEKRSA